MLLYIIISIASIVALVVVGYFFFRWEKHYHFQNNMKEGDLCSIYQEEVKMKAQIKLIDEDGIVILKDRRGNLYVREKENIYPFL